MRRERGGRVWSGEEEGEFEWASLVSPLSGVQEAAAEEEGQSDW